MASGSPDLKSSWDVSCTQHQQVTHSNGFHIMKVLAVPVLRSVLYMSLAVNHLCFLSTQKVINDTMPTLSVTELSLCKSFKCHHQAVPTRSVTSYQLDYHRVSARSVDLHIYSHTIHCSISDVRLFVSIINVLAALPSSSLPKQLKMLRVQAQDWTMVGSREASGWSGNSEI